MLKIDLLGGNKMRKVVIVDYVYLGGLELFKAEKEHLEEHGIDLVFADCKTEEQIINAASDADIILCCGNPPITRKVISSLEKCIAVIRYGIGVNSVDLEAATEYNKIVYFMPGFCIEELVLHATALILNLLRNVNYFDSSIRAGNWPKAKGYMPRRLSNLVLGLYGFGGSARPMATLFKEGFKSKVIACDPYVSDQVYEDYGVEKVSFNELLNKSDIISIHVPLNKETHHIFNKEAFSKMKNTSMIVNIARGPIINEEDLIEALKQGQIKYAGLDVFEKEPIDKNNELLKMNNVVLTPHSAFYGEESLQNQHLTAARLVISTLVDKKIVIENVANKDVLNKFKLLY